MRRSATSLIPLALALAALLAAALADPVIAQSQPPAATAAPAAPSPTPTPTLPESVGVGAEWERLAWLWDTYGPWLLGIVALIALALALRAFGAGLLKALEKLGERAGEALIALFGRLFAWRRLSPPLRAYLDWLRGEYGRLPPIGVATEQVALDLAAVHVPLRVVERDAAEAYYRRMRGEGGADNPDEVSEGAGAIFAPLSEPRLLERAIRRAHQQIARRPGQARQLELFVDLPGGSRRPERPPQTFTRLLLLGDAGSGKTTTLRFAALRCAEAYRRGDRRILSRELGLELRRPPLPIYVRLTHFAAALPADIDALPPEERRRYIGAPPSLFLEWLDQASFKRPGLPAGALSGMIRRPEGCLLLLDGLDEAGDEGRRAFIAELIGNLAADNPGHRYVVASRTAGYGGRVRLPDFAERHLSPLDGDEIRGLITRWYAAVDARMAETGRASRQEQAEAQSARLWGAIERNVRLFEMATNPLLATTMALLQFNNVRLPDQRAKLYEKLVELLLDLWRRQNLGNDTLVLSVAQLVSEQRRVEHLALKMQQQPGQAREVSLHQAQKWLSPLYVERMKIDAEAADARVRALLDSLSLDSGLIQRRENGYSFSHYTFQEYLAARALDDPYVRAEIPDSVAFLLARSADARWRETLLLAAGHWSNGQPDKAERLVRDLLDSGDDGCARLAAEALADIGPSEDLTELRADAVARLPAIAFDPARCPSPRDRVEAAELLDRLDGDDRPALDPLRPEYWAARVEPGPFMFEEQSVRRKVEGRMVAREEKVPAYSYQIRRPYALARFPVTNRQYLAFLEDLERQGKADEAGKRRPPDWPGRRYRPGSGSHPVMSVTWYDATTYAAWLDGQLRAHGLLSPGEELRLPTEPEWERAAAYPLQIPAEDPLACRREYPWGAWPEPLPAEDTTVAEAGDALPEPAQIRANTRELGLGDTSPVGIFPHGAAGCGAEELAGNAWEWCANPYLPHPLPNDLRAETLDTVDKFRTYVLRGGSWLLNRSLARCGARSPSSLAPTTTTSVSVSPVCSPCPRLNVILSSCPCAAVKDLAQHLGRRARLGVQGGAAAPCPPFDKLRAGASRVF